MTEIIGSAMCNYCNLIMFGNCFELVQRTGKKVINMNDVCPKGRKIHKGHIIFERGGRIDD